MTGTCLAVVDAAEVAGVSVRQCGSCSWFRWGNDPTYCARGQVEMAPADGCTRWAGPAPWHGGRVAGGRWTDSPADLGGRQSQGQENE